jgi:putative endonuclease
LISLQPSVPLRVLTVSVCLWLTEGSRLKTLIIWHRKRLGAKIPYMTDSNPSHVFLGKQGEEIAENYLKDKGYFIIEKNFHSKYGEVDIICEKNNNLVFVEVKYRNNKNFGLGEESISPSKIGKLKRTIEVWLSKNGNLYQNHNYYLNAIIIDKDLSIIEYEIL